MLEKEKALAMTIKQIEKQFERASIMKLGEQSSRLEHRGDIHIIYWIDIALGIGGVPRKGS